MLRASVAKRQERVTQEEEKSKVMNISKEDDSGSKDHSSDQECDWMDHCNVSIRVQP